MSDGSNITISGGSTASQASDQAGSSDSPAVTIESIAAGAASQVQEQPSTRPVELTTSEVTFTPEDKKKIEDLSKSIDLTKKDIESTYGADAQRTMGEFADSILDNTRSKDAGEAGALMQHLASTIDEANLTGVKKIPIIGKITMKGEEIRRRYQKVTPQIDDIVDRLLKSQAQMQADIAMYDSMYDRNYAQYKALKIYVAAGRETLSDFEKNQLPQLEAKVQGSNDPMQAQVLKDFKDKLDRFAKRLDDLDRISVITLQNAPQIKILQNADRKVADKVNTTITTTIPLWKSQMVIALGLERQKQAIELQNAVDETTNRLLSENAQMLHTGAVNAEKANQRSVVDIETLQKVNTELIATLKETQQIQEEGRQKRAEAEQQMRTIETDLKTALSENLR
jgi:uncharacterized protein YaaN involved in tellurite resistance